MATKLKPAAQQPATAPAEFTLADAQAMQALASGTAEEMQQKRALKWIIEQACATYQWPYREVPRETDIALGKQFVGQQIVGLLHVDISSLRRQTNA